MSTASRTVPTTHPATRPVGPDAGAPLVASIEREALGLVRDTTFVGAWSELVADCPWAGAFQSPAFCRVWYETYHDVWEPLVACVHDTWGRLRGLLPLARHRSSGEIAVAGTHHAEYQTWIASPADGNDIGRLAVRAALRAFPTRRLVLRYLAPGSPTDWTTSGELASACSIETMSRALVDVAEPSAGAASLRKKSNKSRMSRLRRSGDVVFERVSDGAGFGRLLDELITVYDFRQGAVHDVLPFAADPLKRRFHERLFDETDLLHCTALRVGERLAAGHVGVLDRDAVCLGVYGYAPEHAPHSPGKLLLLHLAGLLEDEDVPVLDMTPGPGWKDRFATRTDEVAIVTIDPSPLRRARAALRVRVDALAKRLALAVGTSPDEVRGAIRTARALGPTGVLRRALSPTRALGLRREVLVFSYVAATARRLERADALLRTGSIDDLACFAPSRRGETRTDFLEHARHAVESGATPYTLVEEGTLLVAGYRKTASGKRPEHTAGVDVDIPAGDVLLEVCRPHAGADGRGLAEATLRRLVRDAADEDEARHVWIAVDAEDAWLVDVVRRVGFEYRHSVHTARGREPRTAKRHRPQPAVPLRERLYHATKRACLHAARGLGLFALARRLTRDELRILCYHGFALDDESGLGPRLFMEPETFSRRMDLLAQWGYPVLPLDDALEHLDAGTLPPAAAVLTIDDGPWSILAHGIEPLERHGFPATLYQTTYYVTHPNPVFRMAVQYLAWRSPLSRADLGGIVPGVEGTWERDTPARSEELLWQLIRHGETALDEPGRMELAREIGARLNVDHDDLVQSRLVSLLTADELRDLQSRGIDLQIHTHRHLFPADRDVVRREIADNRAVLEPIRGAPLTHICYPSNEYSPEQFPWLRELGVRSGTTCNPGLNPRGTEPLELNRFLDGECIADIEFAAELSGFLELARRALRRARR